jgi:microcystin-dependent protein
MPKPATTRLGLPQYEDSENASFSAQVNAVSAAIDAKACIFVKGTFAARGAPGIVGRYYLAEDGTKAGCKEGDLYYDTGTEWVGPRNFVTGPPLGSMMDYSLSGDPVDGDGVTRWLVADGRAISRATYAAFFAAIQAAGLLATWGEGNGTTTFNIPDMRERVALGAGLGTGGSGGSGPGLGSQGGEWKHTLTVGEMPAHGHGITDPGHKHPMAHEDNSGAQISYVPGGSGGQTGSLGHEGYNNGFIVTQIATTGVTVNGAGGGAAHANVQPFTALNKIIRVL